MKRIIKSEKEIEKEINDIFNIEDCSVVSSKLVDYLNNLTGKELLSKRHIALIIILKFYEIDIERLKTILPNKDLLREIKPVYELFQKFRIGHHVINSFSLSDLLHDFTDEIIAVCSEYQKYLLPKTDSLKVKKRVLKKEIAFKKLNDFLIKNKDVENLLTSFLYQAKQKLIIKLILDKIIPLQAILIYFDKSLNVKQNTEMFYLLLDKKVPRQKIQSVIMDNLSRIKEGKYSVLVEYVYNESTLEKYKSKILRSKRYKNLVLSAPLKK